MTLFLKALRLIVVLAALGFIGYTLYGQVKPYFIVPCEKPLTYAIASYDARFGISRSELEDALLDAERVWEEAAGKDLFTFSPSGEIGVSLIYGEVQEASQLGENIDGEQAAYNAKKAELEELKETFERAKRVYDSDAEVYDERSSEYHEQVNWWNSQGGAPPEEYEKLQEMREELERLQDALKERAADINDISMSINDRVDELNAFARKLNEKVDEYNQSAVDEFDQGDYQEDQTGKRINVYEFGSGTDLRRVLAHEFGHALTIEHVENPSSIMYSFNAGAQLVLSEEDRAALTSACRLD
jgi:DNA-directed RNA polymerase beta' subunit